MSREPRHYAQEMFGGLPPDEFLRPGSPLKSTAEDRATLGPSWQQMPAHDDWDSNGWANGHPTDTTDYKREARGAASNRDWARGTYWLTASLLREQERLAKEAHTANLIAFAASLEKGPLKYDLHDLIEKELGL